MSLSNHDGSELLHIAKSVGSQPSILHTGDLLDPPLGSKP